MSTIKLVSNERTHGAAIFSDEKRIRQQSLKVYTYLVCKSRSRNTVQEMGDTTRVFQQKDIVLTKMRKALEMDERTIKKYWRLLEEEGLIRFKPIWTNANEELKTVALQTIKKDEITPFTTLTITEKEKVFNAQWKIRNKHKDSYYEIPRPRFYRKVPEKTLSFLNEMMGASELVMKVYIILINLQEEAFQMGKNYYYTRFTYADLCKILNFTLHSTTIKRLEAAIIMLKKLGLINLELINEKDQQGGTRTYLCLKNVSFYLEDEIMGVDISNEPVISEETILKIKKALEKELEDKDTEQDSE